MITLLNEKWLFHRGDIYEEFPTLKGPVYSQSKTIRKQAGPAAYSFNDAVDQFVSPSGLLNHGKWEWVDLPHDYVVTQDLSPEENNALGFLKYENAWYRKHFTLPEGSKGKRITLRFDGVAGNSTIYLNGCLMGHNFSAYNTFEIDISDNVYFDKENVLAIYIDAKRFEGWWYQGGGIYRDVHLSITEPVAIDLWGVYAPYEKIGDHTWRINFQTTLVNTGYESAAVSVESRVLNAVGDVVATAFGEGNIPLRDKTTVFYSTLVENPMLWDCDTPNLYTVQTLLYQSGSVIDENTTRIGFRTVEASSRGLFINGKKTFIKGVCCHQDFGLTGLAVPDNVAKYKISLLKEMGANGYRTSHYQQTESYMDALDEQGFLVLDEARWFESTKESFEQIESLVKRDRNRPSVIFWCTSNEELIHITDMGQRIHRAVAAHIRKFDNTRLIVAAEDKAPEESQVYQYSDVVSINYSLGSYDLVHEQYPDMAVLATECAAAGTTRDWNFPANENGRVRDMDHTYNPYFQCREATWKHLMARPYVVGMFQWNGAEYRGESSWPRMCSISGSLDMNLYKKGAFYQNRSYFTEEPMAHIVPHWNFSGLEGERITVPVYTNCDELELFLNGISQGRQTIEKYSRGQWEVAYMPGELLVVGYRAGKEVCRDVRHTTGRPVKLRLTKDIDFEANGRDLALFTCECLDEQGNVVPDAAEFVQFTVSSPAKIVGTGSDNCDGKNVALPERQMYMGKIRIAVKPGKGQPNFSLYAMSKNCGYAVCNTGEMLTGREQ